MRSLTDMIESLLHTRKKQEIDNVERPEKPYLGTAIPNKQHMMFATEDESRCFLAKRMQIILL